MNLLDVTGISNLADLAKTIIDKIFPDKLSEEEKLKATVELQTLLANQEVNVVNAGKDISIAEIQSTDAWTRRSRPSIIYAGLSFIALNNVLVPLGIWIYSQIIGVPCQAPPNLNLPSEFWWAWAGICGVYSIGRTFEKRGVTNAVVDKIVGK